MFHFMKFSSFCLVGKQILRGEKDITKSYCFPKNIDFNIVVQEFPVPFQTDSYVCYKATWTVV